MEMGTGKSLVVAHEAAELAKRGKLDLLVVVAPDGVHRKWAVREIPLHGEFEAIWLESGKKPSVYAEIEKRVAKAVAEKRPIAVCIGYTAVAAKTAAYLLVARLVGWYGRKTMLVLDESHRIKTPGAKRRKTLDALGRRVAYRRILSGTPITRGYEDLYAQFHFLHPAILGFRTFAEFKAVHCVMGGETGDDIVDYQYTQVLLDKIGPFIFRARKKDCLDLPPKVYDELICPLSREQRFLYDQVKEEYLLWLDAQTAIDVEMAVTRLIRLQQITGGFVGDNPENFRPIEDVPRLKDLKTLVEDALEGDDNIIVWARFRPEIERISELLRTIDSVKRTPEKIVTFVGRKPKERHLNDEALEAFQARRARVLVGTQAAGGIGHDMTAGSIVVYYSNTFAYEDRAQSEDRAHRFGQDRKVTYYDLIAPNTLDRKILSVLKRRRSLADEVTEGRAAIKKLLTLDD